MRCSLRSSLTLAAAFLLFLLLINLYMTGTGVEDAVAEEKRKWAQEVAMQELHSEMNVQHFQALWNNLTPVNVSYQYLAGAPSPRKKYLTVGLSSVKRSKGNYLLETLKSIFTQSSDPELKEMVVVVHLADFDMEWNSHTAKQISDKFSSHIALGRLLLIHAPQDMYPPLEGLKRNYNDPEERVKFRSKQNVDYAFLVNFCANLSSYYLMLEDDVQCAKSFFTAIRKVLALRENSYWVTLEFSKLGYIGKLYRSSDLPRLAQLLFLFYQEMPCDWLLTYFRLLLTQKDVMRFRPSLFQHIGSYSSFQGNANRLRDDEFEEDSNIPDNPPANIFTSISTFENHHASHAYSKVEEYFWGRSPATGDYFTIVFNVATRITRIQVKTGSEERQTDYLHNGQLALGQHLSTDGKECSQYLEIGSFSNGQFDKKGIEELANFPVECVKITVAGGQSEWLIIHDINIWTVVS
ncbi:alpha-1,3-mannosyl-glycoprotein 4-beta-N-acetylglucosaminyltransferase C-like [Rhinatrema bivittatum]|uniref:alpha-1,3-mannosyl-glycoprotein 4-beta-N-acetylglucosaminyltransferase C-like n=1 Tax=Rhinatrema bivittatum TaxID=194408 RepID=UPI00112CF2F5|nr:alpha-1,3-mannosyl-glycoprotein 4-beta-N-acetylglucosaminyltransferase C-like [Rhinatrema bivittatum]XP_029429195.1 alpha-1,3-mannosyl-glycoprotein 4-beta-N-acetylglucosaminyltransferase C-like [Rhinatrema bivittatum]XP_029429196.1 alpha-1,3-mannosyl-glycoprotein 4-beta-N-acetylglucosaminyltransferase C-like [Rhinatrema bivittatum]